MLMAVLVVPVMVTAEVAARARSGMRTWGPAHQTWRQAHQRDGVLRCRHTRAPARRHCRLLCMQTQLLASDAPCVGVRASLSGQLPRKYSTQ